jgi:lysophospholipase L1-like esterase
MRVLAGLLVLCACAAIGCAVPTRASEQSPPIKPPAAMAVISRNVPAFSSGFVSGSPPSNANDSIYDALDAHSWISTTVPAWIAYDLSGVPVAQRGKADVLWINNVGAYQYNLASGATPLGLPTDYTIEVSSAQQSTPPSSGWTTLVQVTGNIYKSRQHVVDLGGARWIRMSITRVTGGSAAYVMHLDVQDLSQSPLQQPEDSWIYYGDSITFGGLNYMEHYVGSPDDFSFASLIHAQLSDHFPAQEDGGVIGTSVVDAVQGIDGWIAIFPGKFVGLAYGTNDVGHLSPDTFYADYVTLVQHVLSAGKVPIVPKIPWGKTSAVQTYGPALNAKIDLLYNNFSQVVRGPDLWTLFQQNPSLINDGDVHPTTAGYGQMRQWWVQAMLPNVYGLGTASRGPADQNVALGLALHGPNPARSGQIRLDLSLPSDAPASVEVFDARGRRVVARELGALGAGSHSVELQLGNLAPGLYLARLKQGSSIQTLRLTVLR